MSGKEEGGGAGGVVFEAIKEPGMVVFIAAGMALWVLMFMGLSTQVEITSATLKCICMISHVC